MSARAIFAARRDTHEAPQRGPVEQSPYAEAFVYLAASVETLAGVMLVLAICTRWAALMAAGVLAVAVYALFLVGGFKWVWNLGGFEYPAFWAITCTAVALTEFKKASFASSVGYSATRMRTA